MLARLVPLFMLLAAFLIVHIARQQARRPRSDRVYRPHANPWRRGAASDAAWADAANGDSDASVARAELEGLRDAYSSAALDASQPLYRCSGCQACYHRTSLDALHAHNAGRCVLCGSGDLRALRVR